MSYDRDRDDWVGRRLKGVYLAFEPENGSRYHLTLVNDEHGGILVIWPTVATYRYYAGDYLKFLHGKKNEVDRLAIFDWLEEYLWNIHIVMIVAAEEKKIRKLKRIIVLFVFVGV